MSNFDGLYSSFLYRDRTPPARHPGGSVSRFPYHRDMSIAGQFITELQRERRSGNVSSETEQHLKHEFRKLGWDASDSTLVAAIGVEIDRLTREAATLRKLRDNLFGSV
jgi:hypothetical protein